MTTLVRYTKHTCFLLLLALPIFLLLCRIALAQSPVNPLLILLSLGGDQHFKNFTVVTFTNTDNGTPSRVYLSSDPTFLRLITAAMAARTVKETIPEECHRAPGQLMHPSYLPCCLKNISFDCLHLIDVSDSQTKDAPVDIDTTNGNLYSLVASLRLIGYVLAMHTVTYSADDIRQGNVAGNSLFVGIPDAASTGLMLIRVDPKLVEALAVILSTALPKIANIVNIKQEATVVCDDDGMHPGGWPSDSPQDALPILRISTSQPVEVKNPFSVKSVFSSLELLSTPSKSFLRILETPSDPIWASGVYKSYVDKLKSSGVKSFPCFGDTMKKFFGTPFFFAINNEEVSVMLFYSMYLYGVWNQIEPMIKTLEKMQK